MSAAGSKVLRPGAWVSSMLNWIFVSAFNSYPLSDAKAYTMWLPSGMPRAIPSNFPVPVLEELFGMDSRGASPSFQLSNKTLSLSDAVQRTYVSEPSTSKVVFVEGEWVTKLSVRSTFAPVDDTHASLFSQEVSATATSR